MLKFVNPYECTLFSLLLSQKQLKLNCQEISFVMCIFYRFVAHFLLGYVTDKNFSPIGLKTDV